jgi:hypothetical protein
MSCYVVRGSEVFMIACLHPADVDPAHSHGCGGRWEAGARLRLCLRLAVLLRCWHPPHTNRSQKVTVSPAQGRTPWLPESPVRVLPRASLPAGAVVRGAHLPPDALGAAGSAGVQVGMVAGHECTPLPFQPRC